MPHIFKLRARLQEKLVLLAMADHAHKDGTACSLCPDTGQQNRFHISRRAENPASAGKVTFNSLQRKIAPPHETIYVDAR